MVVPEPGTVAVEIKGWLFILPNDYLEGCHEALLAQGGAARMLTLADAGRAPNFALWDETGARMVPFPRSASLR